jgi:hypothetical protein
MSGRSSHRNILIMGGRCSFHMFCRIGFGIPGSLMNTYVDWTVKNFFAVKFHRSWPWSFLSVTAFIRDCSFVVSRMKKDDLVVDIDVSCKGGIFAAMCLADWLSQNIFIGLLISKFKSVSTCFIQDSSLAVDVIARYSASALDRATTFYFLLFHVTRFPPTNVQKPVIDFLSNLPAQSASE